jgi:hypothetical protein
MYVLWASQSMLPAFSACCEELVGRWAESAAGSEGWRELDVWPELQNPPETSFPAPRSAAATWRGGGSSSSRQSKVNAS